MYHAPQAAAAAPSRHARLWELIRQQNLAAKKKPANVVRVAPKPKVQAKGSEALEVEFEFNTDRMLKSASNSLLRAN
ncbi:MAG: hypothetical protein MK208_05270 [Shimia sp.]|jgi:hypothetical protein|uniref:hypothetical protein n=1 Tax=Shimia sp. TaxID=1954381 RepID=UPI0025FF594A|nr:hypothetical protein [Shimia sp.]MCH2066620.1 hypothetical protein [Shimia sp.]